jgi:uroporphyrinogen-III decarboxylase
VNGRQREALTMRHLEPDRVPVHCQLSIGHYNLNAGYKPHEIWYNTEAFADATIKLAKRYQFDGILVLLPGRKDDFFQNRIKSIEEKDDGEWITWVDGDRTFLPWDDMPHHYPEDTSIPLRANFDTFNPEIDIHSIDDYMGYTWNLFHHLDVIPEKDYKGPLQTGNIPDYFFDTIDIVKSKAGHSHSIHASVYSPLTNFFELFGYEEALIGFVTDKGKVHAILELLTDGVIAWALALVERGADAIDLSSAFVAAPFLSREMYREFVIPYEYMVNQAIKSAGCIVYTHTCGSIGDRLDLMIETGTQGIDTLDPPPLGDGDLAAAKRAYGDRLFFKGNLNSVALLNYSTENEVIAEAAQKIEIGKPGAGFILGTACSVAPKVEPWKLELLVPLAEEIGRY